VKNHEAARADKAAQTLERRHRIRKIEQDEAADNGIDRDV
jgi:hypothetical protein